MYVRPDCRGQTVQVGALLVFGAVVLAVSIFQLQGVPQEVQQTEVEHNQQVADQLVALNSALVVSTTTATPQSRSITLGTRYDRRLPFVYPPPVAGTIETTEPNELRIENVSATGDSASFENYWNGSSRNYTTRGMKYSIGYNELRGTPDYVFEYGVHAAQFETTTQVQLRQQFQSAGEFEPVVDGANISLIVYDGDLEVTSTSTESLTVERVTAAETIEVDGDGDPITLELPTELNESVWNETLEIKNESSTVESFSHNGESVRIEFKSVGEIDQSEYRLTLHKVDVGPNATRPEPTYIKSTYEARDQFNDIVDEPVETWVYNESNTKPAQAVYDITERKKPYDTSNLDGNEFCFTIDEAITDSSSHKTLGEGCQA